ncbi:MAG: BadF/BadG/BcrA/BcrD ATPase family protein [Gemmatimonadales bacterium]|nr:BadF/BadG/BcrA/BcrD ATPase family protein [Gemmatimonadales bacterium]
MIIITADVGGSKTTVAITKDGERMILARGPGAGVRPGRALTSATAIADQIRSAMAQANLLKADAVIVGAAGAGRTPDAEEIRVSLARERIAGKVIVVSDVMLAFAALGVDVGVVLVAGTGSVAVGRTPAGKMVRQGGFGWKMGDEGAGYWIGQQALRAVGLAEDGRAPTTSLRAALLKAVGAPDFRDVVGWSTVATPREVANLSRAVVHSADDGDPVAKGILDRAATELARLVNQLAGEFPNPGAIPVGLAGGLLSAGGPLGGPVSALLQAPFVPLNEAVDPLLGGPKLLAASA